MSNFPFDHYTHEQLEALARNDEIFWNCEPFVQMAIIRAKLAVIAQTKVGSQWERASAVACKFYETYRLDPESIPEDMRVKKSEFVGCEIDEDGYCTTPDGVRRTWWDCGLQRLPGYRGVIYEWRGRRWIEGKQRRYFLDVPTGQYGIEEEWIIDPDVEKPTPIAVRFEK